MTKEQLARKAASPALVGTHKVISQAPRQTPNLNKDKYDGYLEGFIEMRELAAQLAERSEGMTAAEIAHCIRQLGEA